VINGNLDYQIDTALAIIKNNCLLPSLINGTKTEIGEEFKVTLEL
jgi:hypothetical protein